MVVIEMVNGLNSNVQSKAKSLVFSTVKNYFCVLNFEPPRTATNYDCIFLHSVFYNIWPNFLFMS